MGARSGGGASGGMGSGSRGGGSVNGLSEAGNRVVNLMKKATSKSQVQGWIDFTKDNAFSQNGPGYSEAKKIIAIGENIMKNLK